MYLFKVIFKAYIALEAKAKIRTLANQLIIILKDENIFFYFFPETRTVK